MLRKIEKSIFLSKPIIGIVTRLENNMHKINKKLTNVIKVSGKSEKIEEFINKIKENEISILYFEIPNKVYCTTT